LDLPESAYVVERPSGVDLRASVGIPSFKNPILRGRGAFGCGVEFSHLVDLDRLSGIVAKGHALEPVSGTRVPRMCETPGGTGDARDLQNVGVRGFVGEKLHELCRCDAQVIPKVVGTEISRYAEVVRTIRDAEGLAAYELVISSANLNQGGARFGTDPSHAAQVVGAARNVTKWPMCVRFHISLE
jgi:dihydroorotate dehydrogenase (NAD+) catalytic subunit